jgi:cell division protease FtsH
MNKELGNRDRLQNNNDKQQSPNPTGRPKPNGQSSQQQRPSNSLNKWLFLLVGVMLIIWLYNYFNTSINNPSSSQIELTYSEYYKQVGIQNGEPLTGPDGKPLSHNVKTAVFVGPDTITGEFHQAVQIQKNKTRYTQYRVYQLPHADNQLPQDLIASGAKVTSQTAPDNSLWLTLLTVILPWVLLLGLIFFFSRRASQGQQGIFSFGKSRAKLILEDRPSTTFADVAGVDESKYELQEVVEFLKTPQKFQRLGGKIPRGVLLVGPPGTGKTLLARAVAGEAGVPFFSMSGSEFVEVLVGVGASRVRDLFDQAKKASPSIIFIDEIDAVGRQRGSSINTNDEREQTLNQLLVEMDGFDNRQAVVVIAATNRPDGLDVALLRPGRFDRRVTVDRPDWNGRLAILKIHTRKVPLDRDVDLTSVARATTGMVGADLANLVNEAALLAARRNLDAVNHRSFDEALDKILLGAERPLVLSNTDLNVTAYHEGGHALTGLLLEGSDPVTKVTIIPRGQALGVTMYTPLDDRYNYSREYLLARVVTLLGGRAAEQIVFEEITTGAENDLQRVTQVVRQMVMRWGMSERLGTISYSTRENPFTTGGDTGTPSDYSEETAQLIDDEVQRIVGSCYEQAITLLTTYRPTLDRIAQELRRNETIDVKQMHKIMEETGAPLAESQRHVTPQTKSGVLAPPPPIEPVTPPEVQ